MVHYYYFLSAKGDNAIPHIVKGIDAFCQHHHNYIPHNTFFDRFTRGGQPSNPDDTNYHGESVFRCDVWQAHPSDYVRTEKTQEKDEWGRHKIYLEYGWGIAPDFPDDAEEQSAFVGHRGTHSKGYPLHPATIRYTLKIRHITDWSAKEQQELNNFVSKIIEENDYGYKGADEYTQEDINAWQSGIDWAEQEQCLIAHKINEPKKYKDFWTCAICKGGYHRNPDKRNDPSYDFGHNAEPAMEYGTFRCCSGCNGNFILALRLKAKREDFDFPAGEHYNPFVYPKPEDENFGKIMENENDQRGFFMCPGGDFNWDSDQAKEQTWNEARNTQRALIDKLTGLLESCRTKTGLAKAFSRSKEFHDLVKNEREQVKKECEEDLKDKIDALNREQATTNIALAELAQEKKEIKQSAQEARKAIAQLREAQKPAEKKIETLKQEIANRDKKIAEIKWAIEYVDDMPVKMKMKMVLRELRGARIILQQDEDKEPTYYQRVSKFNVPGWAMKMYREQKSLEKKAQEKKPVKQKKTQKPKVKCAYCSNEFHENQLTDVWGDLLCRRCAK